MEKRPRPLEKLFGPVKLYLGDLRACIELFQQLPQTGKIKIGLGDYNLTSLSELTTLGRKETDTIDIWYLNYSPDMSVNLSVTPSNSFLRCNDDSPVLQGIFSKVENIILTHRRKWKWIETLFGLATAMTTPAFISIILGLIYKLWWFPYFGYFLLALWILSGLLLLITSTLRKSKVYFIERDEHPSFWLRNKDRILVGIMTSVISILIGIAATLIVQRVTRR